MDTTKRRFSRIHLKFPATLIVGGAEVFDILELANLSVGGCLVPLDAQINENEACTISIRLVGGLGNTTINVGGKIVRHDMQYVAIQFTRISPDDLFHLQNLIRYNAPDPDRIDEEIHQHPGLM